MKTIRELQKWRGLKSKPHAIILFPNITVWGGYFCRIYNIFLLFIQLDNENSNVLKGEQGNCKLHEQDCEEVTRMGCVKNTKNVRMYFKTTCRISNYLI